MVVGPTHDGGYYLVGAKAAHPALFESDGMGTGSALDRLLTRTKALELSTGFTEPFYDIDVANDLILLARELRLAPAKAPRTAAGSSEWQQAVAQLRHVRKAREAHTIPQAIRPRRHLAPVALTFCCTQASAVVGEPSFFIPLAVAAVAYLLAIRELFSSTRISAARHRLRSRLAALWHFQFLRMPPGLDDDIHRYVWDGRIQRLGYNPYFVVPSDPALASLHTSETRTLNNPEVPSPYPAGAQLFFRAVTSIRESTFALKVAFVVCDFAIVLLSARFLASFRASSALGSGLCLAPTAGD